ncbi:MAG: SDR family oxidoreductase [Gemmatimonadetes bacterium]|nr:SDR family oxidoreductase [Candidatus Palauibacter australiensis]
MPERLPGLATVLASVLGAHAGSCLGLLAAFLAGSAPLAGQAGSETAGGGPFPPAWPFAIGQEAEYAVTFGPVRFGQMHLRVEAQDTIRNTPAYRIAMEMKGSIPGLVRTKFAQALWGNPELLDHVLARTPAGRIGQPRDITGAALYLASAASDFTTGAVFVLDGGVTAQSI